MIIKNIKDALEQMSQKYLEACKTGTISEIKDIDKELSEILALFKDVTKTDVTLDLVDIKSLKEELLLSIEKVNGFYNAIQLKLNDDKLRGRPGKDGIAIDGNDGYTPVKNKDYFDGKDGKTPKKGVDYFDGESDYNLLSNKPFDSKYNRQLYNAHFDRNSNDKFVLLKTNIRKSNKMLDFEFKGYNYSKPSSIFSLVSVYTFVGSASPYRLSISNNLFALVHDFVYSEDGFLVLIINGGDNINFDINIRCSSVRLGYDLSSFIVTDTKITDDLENGGF